jgi:serine/threonine-protein kinase
MKDLRKALAGLYDIETPLGRGGMADVYLARERRLDRRVALKVLAPRFAADETSRQRFLSEARTVARLTHPNIVPIFTVDEIGRFVFFAMAYVAGKTLAERVEASGPLSPHQAARLVCSIGEALDYAHARGVVHRDVKPDNILLDAVTGRALLTDFGIAHQSPRSRRLVGRASAPGGYVVGTPGFMSPEQANGEVVDGRSDIYSLGVVTYYALSGQLPFYAATDELLLALHVAAPPPPLGTVAPHVPPRFAQIVDRCLAKDPWQRFADAAALVRAVAEAVVPPPAPLAIRAFLVRSTHLEVPALIHAFITGVGVFPATLYAWTSSASVWARAIATLALLAILALPVAVAIVRVRRLLAAGHRHEDLVAALISRQARRREERAFVYGEGPTSFERVIGWLARVSLLVAIGAVAASLGGLLDLPSVAAAAAATALLASVTARAQTEQRTDPIGERMLRFWGGPFGRVLFRVAALRRPAPDRQPSRPPGDPRLVAHAL